MEVRTAHEPPGMQHRCTRRTHVAQACAETHTLPRCAACHSCRWMRNRPRTTLTSAGSTSRSRSSSRPLSSPCKCLVRTPSRLRTDMRHATYHTAHSSSPSSFVCNLTGAITRASSSWPFCIGAPTLQRRCCNVATLRLQYCNVGACAGRETVRGYRRIPTAGARGSLVFTCRAERFEAIGIRPPKGLPRRARAQVGSRVGVFSSLPGSRRLRLCRGLDG